MSWIMIFSLLANKLFNHADQQSNSLDLIAITHKNLSLVEILNSLMTTLSVAHWLPSLEDTKLYKRVVPSLYNHHHSKTGNTIHVRYLPCLIGRE